MSLDVRTIFVMFAILALMFSGLLVLAGLHAGNIKGVKQWAVANLCMSLGLGLAYFYNIHTPGYDWSLVLGASLLAAGISLQLTGIRTFRDKHIDWRIALLIVGVTFLQGVWFSVLHPDIGARSIANSLLFAIVYAACARELLISIEPPLRTAYWFTGLSFIVLSVIMLARVMVIWLLQPHTYGLFVDMPFNPLSFLIACMVQLCVTFGFVLMLNYRLVADLQKIAARDVLTGAFNRRRLEEEADRLWARCSRTGDTMAIMMIDVDHFKSINDRYGHPAGDEVLRRLVAIAQATIRADDYFARYGGEEFCILLPSTTEQEALLLAERLRKVYEAMTVEFGSEAIKSTISIGVADSTQAGLAISSLLAAVDLALYRAKQLGRNRVVLHSGTA